jgi:lysophospholipase-2
VYLRGPATVPVAVAGDEFRGIAFLSLSRLLLGAHFALSTAPLRACLLGLAALGRAHSTRAMKPSLPDVLLGKRQGASSAVILCHGLGDTSEGWSDTVRHALVPGLPDTLFILPTAPTQPVTINGGASCPSWYDIESLSRSRSLERCAGLEDSVARVHGLVAAQVAAGVPESRVALVGFSQGGALSLFSALNWQGAPLGGAFVLSGYLPRPGDAKPSAATRAQMPVRLYHGTADGVVPLAAAHDAESRTRAMGMASVQLQVYDGLQHSANEPELADLLRDLRAAFAPPRAPATPEALAEMSTKQLKAFLVERNAGSARIAACLEKAELLALALEVLGSKP